MQKMKQKSEQQALFSLTTICSQSEHCSQEMIEKLQKWEIPEAAQARIMQYLTKEKYIDDARFARFFINDKVKYNKWGRRKVEQALWLKHIGKDISDPIFEEYSDDDWLEILRPLINQKKKTVKGRNAYEANGKLIRFALGRGFDMNLIVKCLDSNVEDWQDD